MKPLSNWNLGDLVTVEFCGRTFQATVTLNLPYSEGLREVHFRPTHPFRVGLTACRAFCLWLNDEGQMVGLDGASVAAVAVLRRDARAKAVRFDNPGPLVYAIEQRTPPAPDHIFHRVAKLVTEAVVVGMLFIFGIGAVLLLRNPHWIH